MKTIQKTLALLLCVLMLAALLAGCAQQQKTAESTPAPSEKSETPDTQPTTPAAEATPAPAEESGTRTITDGLGREVEVPAKVERIVTLGNASRMAVYLQLQDKMVSVANGDQSSSMFMAYGVYNQELWADLPVVASGGYGEINPEAIIELDPDVILCTYEEDIVANIEEQLGRQVVAAPQGTLFAEDYELALRVFGEACGVSARAEAVIAMIHACLDDLDARTSGLEEAAKPLCLTAAATFRGGHGITGVYSDSAILSAINARDAATGLADRPKGVEVDKEQILAWDPAVIILDAGNLALVKDEYAEDSGFFQQLSAVQNGQLYQWPNATANYTNVEIPLVSAYYAGTLLYPEAFADVDFEAKAGEIFDFFLGHADYLQLLNEQGLGYGPFSLED
ncbi:MAG: ABC transporter substrate-binding protein [Oscillospiraceae bacterium]|nr:ABC transporter substrate-binding protein [Oscillospiraceae bacterium]